MRRKAIRAIVLVVVLITLFAGIYLCAVEHQIEFALSFEYTITDKNVGIWEVISQYGFYTEEMFAKEYERSTGEALPLSFDIQEHEYIVCHGYTLKSVSYREENKVGRFTSSRPYYLAKVTLEKAEPMRAYVYELDNRVTIDRDVHINDRTDTIIDRE